MILLDRGLVGEPNEPFDQRWECLRGVELTLDQRAGRSAVLFAPLGVVEHCNDRPDQGRVVANSRQYAWRLDPAQRAVMSDGLLDVLFFPMASRAQLVSWVIKCRLRRHLADRRLVYKRGRVIEIGGDRPPRYQFDGDPPSTADNPLGVEPASTQLQISVRPGVLPVLAP